MNTRAGTQKLNMNTGTRTRKEINKKIVII